MNWWERWKPRPSLFANLVRGAVTWPRIFIWLHQHPNQAFTVEDALRDEVRLSLRSSGGFKKNVKRRTLVGFLLLAISFGLAMFGWCPRVTANQLSPYLPGWLYVPNLVVLITSPCYLAVMGNVEIVYERMNRQSQKINLSHFLFLDNFVSVALRI